MNLLKFSDHWINMDSISSFRQTVEGWWSIACPQSVSLLTKPVDIEIFERWIEIATTRFEDLPPWQFDQKPVIPEPKPISPSKPKDHYKTKK